MRTVAKRCLDGRRRLVGLVGLTALAGGCGMQGFSDLEAELARRHGEGAFHVLSASHDRAIVSARGRAVAIEPAEGLCLSEESIETSERWAFLLIGDCVLDGAEGDAAADASGRLDLPPAVPGIITVSLSGDPGFSRGGRRQQLSELEDFLDTGEGRALLGRSDDGAGVTLVRSRRIDNVLYVLVEDRNGEIMPVLAPRFWRAFVELNDRLAVVTVSGFRDRPMAEETMLGHLVGQVTELADANRVPPDVETIMLATADRPEEDVEVDDAERLVTLEPTAVIVSTVEPAQTRMGEGAAAAEVDETDVAGFGPWRQETPGAAFGRVGEDGPGWNTDLRPDAAASPTSAGAAIELVEPQDPSEVDFVWDSVGDLSAAEIGTVPPPAGIGGADPSDDGDRPAIPEPRPDLPGLPVLAPSENLEAQTAARRPTGGLDQPRRTIDEAAPRLAPARAPAAARRP